MTTTRPIGRNSQFTLIRYGGSACSIWAGVPNNGSDIRAETRGTIDAEVRPIVHTQLARAKVLRTAHFLGRTIEAFL